MRVSTAFNRLLQVPGVSVVAVSFEREGIVVSLRRRARRLVCPRCGCVGRAGYDRRALRAITRISADPITEIPQVSGGSTGG
jgi:transposase